MQTLMLTVEYDGTRYAGWKAAPKKENLDTVSARSILLLPGCSKRTSSYSVPQKQTLVFMQEADSQLSDYFFLLPSALKSSLNQVLPQDIAVLDARQVSERSCRITPQTLYLGALHQNRSDS